MGCLWSCLCFCSDCCKTDKKKNQEKRNSNEKIKTTNRVKTQNISDSNKSLKIERSNQKTDKNLEKIIDKNCEQISVISSEIDIDQQSEQSLIDERGFSEELSVKFFNTFVDKTNDFLFIEFK